MINHQEYRVYDKDEQAYLADAAFIVCINTYIFSIFSDSSSLTMPAIT